MPQPHFQPKAKRIIYLFQSGAPSQFETFDYKPKLHELRGQDLPASVRMGQRLTTMTSGQTSFPMVPSIFPFQQHGQQGAWISDLLPHTARMADDLCIVRSMFTEAINHDPAITFFQTGSQLAGRPSAGAWVAYGLGQLNKDLPAFVVMISRDPTRAADQPLYDRLWGSGFLPTQYQGVKLRSGNDPVLYLANPAGCDRQMRRDMLDDLAALNAKSFASIGDPEIQTRIAQYELAFRMQSAVPELTDISDEPEHILNLYGPEVRKPGTYARNCLLARRLIERDVRFVQLYHMGWDQHNDLPVNIAKQCSRHRSAIGRARSRSQAARLAGRHARDLGRRIRPHRLLARRAHGDQLRPRPSPALLLDLARRRRRSARHDVRRDRRLQLQHHREPGPRARPASDDAASAGPRPQAVDLPLPRPRLPAHRRERRGCAFHTFVANP